MYGFLHRYSLSIFRNFLSSEFAHNTVCSVARDNSLYVNDFCTVRPQNELAWWIAYDHGTVAHPLSWP